MEENRLPRKAMETRIYEVEDPEEEKGSVGWKMLREEPTVEDKDGQSPGSCRWI